MSLGPRPSAESLSPRSCSPSAQDALATEYPLLAEYLTALQWGDGTARTPASLSIFAEAGFWKAWLNDRDLRRTCCVSDPSWSGCLARLELGLAGEPLDWRPARPEGRARKS